MMYLLLFACTKQEETVEFVAALEPIEEISIEAPQGSSSESFPEDYTLASGDEGDYAWVHLRGYIQADMSTVWEALRNDLVYVNQRNASSYTIETIESDEFDYVFVEHNEVENVVTVEFANEWRHLAIEGTKDAPEKVVARWQKISGTEFITALDGSIQILAVDNQRKDVVEVQVIEHLSAYLDPEGEAKTYVTDLFERWVLVSHGEDIPSYD